MARPFDDLVRIVSYGGGMSLSATRFNAEQLQRVASYAKSSGARLVVKDADRLQTEDLQKIASHGGGRVFFEW